MDQKILVFAGKKQSGKSSAAHFVAGYLMCQLGRADRPFLPHNFKISEDGQLLIDTAMTDIDGNTVIGDGTLDLNRRDENFVNWASNCLWPYVKLYSYADFLKLFSVLVFNIPEKLVYGNDEDKNQLIHIRWKDMCNVLPPRKVSEIKKAGTFTSRMTVRQFLQYFGTEVCRKIYGECWTQSCLRQILVDGPALAIIQDCRFPNEVKEAKKYDAKVIKLERSPYKDLHDSEIGLDKMHNSSFDLIVPPDVTIKEKNQLILDVLYEWGWFDQHLTWGSR